MLLFPDCFDIPALFIGIPVKPIPFPLGQQVFFISVVGVNPDAGAVAVRRRNPRLAGLNFVLHQRIVVRTDPDLLHLFAFVDNHHPVGRHPGCGGCLGLRFLCRSGKEDQQKT